MSSLQPGTVGPVPIAFGLGGGLLPFAHHPHCDRHIHHLIWLRGRPFCLGCTALATGVPFGILVAAVAPWAGVSLPVWIIGHALLVAPTALQPFVQKKAFKIVARFLLGAATASYLLSGLFLTAYLGNVWLWRGCVALALATGFLALYRLRRRRLNDPCATCPLGRFPTCEWNMPRLLAENTHDPVWIKIAKDLELANSGSRM